MTPSCPTKHSVLPPPEHIHGGPTAFMACLRHQGTTVDETGAQRSPILKQAEAERMYTKSDGNALLGENQKA